MGVDEVEEVSGWKKKQDVLLGDSSGATRLTLWEEEAGMMDEGGSYRLCGMVVREFRGEKFLSTSKENSTIEAIDDIGDVEEEEGTDEEGTDEEGTNEEGTDEEDTDEEGNSTFTYIYIPYSLMYYLCMLCMIIL